MKKSFMKFKYMLAKKLNLSEDMLPSSYFLVGRVVCVKLKPEVLPYKQKIGQAILDFVPAAHSVLLIKCIDGRTRRPKCELLAGDSNTLTVHKEHGCLFLIDPCKFMWSKGNKAERARIANAVKPNEHVVDMYAGVGYWTIPVAKRVRSVIAIDINKEALEFLQRNLALNKLENVKLVCGDAITLSKKLKECADRVIAAYLWDSKTRLKAAFNYARKGAIIHFHDLLKNNNLSKRINELKMVVDFDVLNVCKIKSYAPGIAHLVYDLMKT